jgi:hypothetical protein
LVRSLLFVCCVAVGCKKPSRTCDDLEQYVAAVANASDNGLAERARSSDIPIGNGEFLPRSGDLVREIAEQCRKGELSAEIKRCLFDATSSLGFDRCIARSR